ncbi:hypothetical protein SASPL_100303 [Salvia splendens]|uniref:Uncharacterized protein n=1 Tax=Salvia splendens TaxID=180675 RepID=A0A8X8YPJ3_SALSN|nr:hypothetical protein SASPL_100303 [Salvia splendens]
MQFRTLQITLLSGKNLPSIKMPIYAVVSISGETDGSKQEYMKPSGSDPGRPAPTRRGISRWSSRWARRRCRRTPSPSNSGSSAMPQKTNKSSSAATKQLFDSRKSPYVGELSFSYKFIDESAPNASGSGAGWNRVENVAGVGIKAAANVLSRTPSSYG